MPMRGVRLMVGLLMMYTTPFAANAEQDVSLPTGGDFSVPVKSFKESRFIEVVRQRMDFSCGSAALATLLTYHYDMPVSEASILSAMYETGDKEKIHKEGFSLLDMKNYLESIGLKAEGYKQSLDKLARVGIPAIVLLDRGGYMHFVVVKGVTKSKVLIGDPAQGLRVESRANFERMWNQILFVVTDMKDIARTRFNSPRVWAMRNQSFDTDMVAANDNLTNFSLSQANPAGYY